MAIKIRLTLTPEVMARLQEMKPEQIIDKAALKDSAAIDAESHLIEQGLLEPTIEAFMWRAWLRNARQRKQAKQPTAHTPTRACAKAGCGRRWG